MFLQSIALPQAHLQHASKEHLQARCCCTSHLVVLVQLMHKSHSNMVYSIFYGNGMWHHYKVNGTLVVQATCGTIQGTLNCQ